MIQTSTSVHRVLTSLTPPSSLSIASSSSSSSVKSVPVEVLFQCDFDLPTPRPHFIFTLPGATSTLLSEVKKNMTPTDRGKQNIHHLSGEARSQLIQAARQHIEDFQLHRPTIEGDKAHECLLTFHMGRFQNANRYEKKSFSLLQCVASGES